MRAKVVSSTESRFLPRTRPVTSKRRGFAVEFGLKVAAAVLGAIGLACAMLCTYLYQSSGYAIPANSAFYLTLKVIETATTGLLLFVLLLKYRAFLSSELRESRLRSLSWRSAGHVWAKLITELIICGICCPIGVSWTWYVNKDYFSAPESIDGVLACVMMFRLYLFIPILPELTGWHSASARAAGRYNHTKVNDWLALRAILLTYPIPSIVTLWVVAVGCFAWALQASEYGICSGGTPALFVPSSPWTSSTSCLGGLGAKNLNDYPTAVWCIIITMLSVGYGDVSALTTMGKTVSVAAGFSGAVLNGMLVATLTGTLALQPGEQRTRAAFDFLVHKGWATRELEWAAGKLILEAAWDNVARRTGRARRTSAAAATASTRNALRVLPNSRLASPGRPGGAAAQSPRSAESRAISRMAERPFETLPQRLRRAIKHFRGARRIYRLAVEAGVELHTGDTDKMADDEREHFSTLTEQMRELAADVAQIRSILVDGAGGNPAPGLMRSRDDRPISPPLRVVRSFRA